ncbi:MAG: glutamine synthetase [Pseudomonadales bacterium]|nr:glutamine synthetase [Pseudomonadales bacterium]
MTIPKGLADRIDLLITDANGVPRGKTIDSVAIQAGGNLPRMAEAVLFQCIHGTYAEETMDAFNPKDEDLILSPDWSTYRRTPWKEDSVGQVICEALDKEGEPLPYDCRNVLKQVLARYEAKGLVPIVAPEIEFYLMSAPKRGDQELEPGAGFDGRDEFGGEAFSFDALDRYGPFVSYVQEMSAAADLALAAVVHEVGAGQIELNVRHGPALSIADQMVLLKRLVKGCALEHGYLASFMSKPSADLPGSGLHLHCSLENQSGENLFSLVDEKAPPALRQFIAGLQTYLPEVFALLAPNINSYKRFAGDLSMPINLEWGYDNRTTGLRVPYGPSEEGRVETRVIGADANPYLLIAAILAAGLLGIEEALDPTVASEEDCWEVTTNLPDNLDHALSNLAESKKMAELLGREFLDVFASIKRSELQDYNVRISSWEVSYLGSML